MFNPITNLHDRPLRHLGHFIHEAAYTMFQLLLLSLLLLGIGGLVFKAIGADGWLPGMLERAWHSDPIYALFVVGGLVISGSYLKRFFDRRLNKINHVGDIMIYGCLGLGVFFGLRLAINGSL
jgi:hypothetical protein